MRLNAKHSDAFFMGKFRITVIPISYAAFGQKQDFAKKSKNQGEIKGKSGAKSREKLVKNGMPTEIDKKITKK